MMGSPVLLIAGFVVVGFAMFRAGIHHERAGEDQ